MLLGTERAAGHDGGEMGALEGVFKRWALFKRAEVESRKEPARNLLSWEPLRASEPGLMAFL